MEKFLKIARIIGEGVLIAITGLVAIIVLVIPYAAAGLANWTWGRIVEAWANNE